MIYLKDRIGMIKKCPEGFSWTVLFLGCFVPLSRADFKWFTIMLGVDVCFSPLSFLHIIFAFIPNIIFAFIYNGIYIDDLLHQGYVQTDKMPNNQI